MFTRGTRFWPIPIWLILVDVSLSPMKIPLQQSWKFNPYPTNSHQQPIATSQHEVFLGQHVPQIPVPSCSQLPISIRVSRVCIQGCEIIEKVYSSNGRWSSGWRAMVVCHSSPNQGRDQRIDSLWRQSKLWTRWSDGIRWNPMEHGALPANCKAMCQWLRKL